MFVIIKMGYKKLKTDENLHFLNFVMSFVASLFVQSIHGLYSKDRRRQVLSTRTNENISSQSSPTGTKFKDFNEDRDLSALSLLFSKKQQKPYVCRKIHL